MKSLLYLFSFITFFFFSFSNIFADDIFEPLELPPHIVEETENTTHSSEELSQSVVSPAVESLLLNTSEDIVEDPPLMITPVQAYFEHTQVQSGAVSWNMILRGNQPLELSKNKVQLWNHFEVISITPSNNDLILQLKQFDGDRLSVECTSYEVNIPAGAILTQTGGTNNTPVSGSFTVVGCPQPQEVQATPLPTFEEDQNTKSGSTLSASGMYLRLIDTDEEGRQYLNLYNFIFLIGILSFFAVVFFVIFGFIKNIFLGKK